MTSIEKARELSNAKNMSHVIRELREAYELAYTEEHAKAEEYEGSLVKQSAYIFELESKVSARDKLLDEARAHLVFLATGYDQYQCKFEARPKLQKLLDAIDTLRKEGR